VRDTGSVKGAVVDTGPDHYAWIEAGKLFSSAVSLGEVRRGDRAGITVAAVARQRGVSRSWASRGANAPDTRLFRTIHRERVNDDY
jgi:hypothetical protein